ncbi:efflux transporter, outer membrane factor lipoprotein, NodT family [Burkholderia pseudomallei MSHR2243]|nr:efflux transporter, outer membrane factor lipoprotein, NodT family [Burkholderia pseudomallei MSHR2243]
MAEPGLGAPARRSAARRARRRSAAAEPDAAGRAGAHRRRAVAAAAVRITDGAHRDGGRLALQGARAALGRHPQYDAERLAGVGAARGRIGGVVVVAVRRAELSAGPVGQERGGHARAAVDARCGARGGRAGAAHAVGGDRDAVRRAGPRVCAARAAATEAPRERAGRGGAARARGARDRQRLRRGRRGAQARQAARADRADRRADPVAEAAAGRAERTGAGARAVARAAEARAARGRAAPRGCRPGCWGGGRTSSRRDCGWRRRTRRSTARARRSTRT